MHRGLLAVLFGMFCAAGGVPGQAPASPSPNRAPGPAASTNSVAGSATNSVAGSATNGVAAIAGVIDAETRELKPHDVFRYRIEQDPIAGADPLRSTVTDSGEAHFNVSRGHSSYVTLKVAGRHLAEVRRELKEKLDAQYYRDSTIKLDLEGVNGPAGSAAGPLASGARVTVWGEMQGDYPVTEGQRLMLSDVILRMGKNDYANLKKIKVQRISPSGQSEETIVNIDKALRENDRSADFELKDGDRIHVPRKSILIF